MELSVIVPVHDVAPWIEEQIDCILRQDVDLEVIVIDDASVDETASLVRRLAAGDDRIRVHRAAAVGGASARNQGLGLARGSYVVFADGDDLVPNGAYRALLDAARTSGAPMAIGRHLKFSSGATWEPMSAWYDVRSSAVTDIDTMPTLLANRACWNRIFRADFLRANEIRFPEVARSNDIVPMVRAMTAAPRIAMVPDVVYLYRQRPGGSSMSARSSNVSGLSSYIGQETAVAAIVATRSAALQRCHARVVLDADGYVHLERFLRGRPSRIDQGCAAVAVRSLLEALSISVPEALRVERRVLWFLVANDADEVAVEFAQAAHEADGELSVPSRLVDAWARAIGVVDAIGDGARFPLDRDALVNDGPLVLLANRAEHTDAAVLDRAVALLEPLLGDTAGQTEVLRAVARAVRNHDPLGLQTVSTVRHLAPLVVDSADPTLGGLTITGRFASPVPDGVRVLLVSTGPGDHELLDELDGDSVRWESRLADEDLRPGRYTVSFRLAFRGLLVEFPVVTARMPLPPVARDVLIQPLADRARGWRFLVERAAPRPGFARRLLRRARTALQRVRD